jgi:hypothetical protein
MDVADDVASADDTSELDEGMDVVEEDVHPVQETASSVIVSPEAFSIVTFTSPARAETADASARHAAATARRKFGSFFMYSTPLAHVASNLC